MCSNSLHSRGVGRRGYGQSQPSDQFRCNFGEKLRVMPGANEGEGRRIGGHEDVMGIDGLREDPDEGELP